MTACFDGLAKVSTVAITLQWTLRGWCGTMYPLGYEIESVRTNDTQRTNAEINTMLAFAATSHSGARARVPVLA